MDHFSFVCIRGSVKLSMCQVSQRVLSEAHQRFLQFDSFFGLKRDLCGNSLKRIVPEVAFFVALKNNTGSSEKTDFTLPY